MKNHFIQLFFFIILVISCKTNDLSTNSSDEIIFNGITMTNIYGEIIYKDINDWNFHDTWSEKEKNLFGKIKNTKIIDNGFNYQI